MAGVSAWAQAAAARVLREGSFWYQHSFCRLPPPCLVPLPTTAFAASHCRSVPLPFQCVLEKLLCSSTLTMLAGNVALFLFPADVCRKSCSVPLPCRCLLETLLCSSSLPMCAGKVALFLVPADVCWKRCSVPLLFQCVLEKLLCSSSLPMFAGNVALFLYPADVCWKRCNVPLPFQCVLEKLLCSSSLPICAGKVAPQHAVFAQVTRVAELSAPFRSTLFSAPPLFRAAPTCFQIGLSAFMRCPSSYIYI
eukprot:363588-Chlamydomonas_euryale.AAC.3